MVCTSGRRHLSGHPWVPPRRGQRPSSRDFALAQARNKGGGESSFADALASVMINVKWPRDVSAFEPKPVRKYSIESTHREALIPADRTGYLGDIARCVRGYHERAAAQVVLVKDAESLEVAAVFQGAKGRHEISEKLASYPARLFP